MVPRAATLGKKSQWLCAFDMGGEVLRFTSGGESVAVESREYGTVVFRTGMDAPSEISRTVTSISLAIQAAARTDWAEVRDRLGPIRGRRARFWFWVEGLTLEEAYQILDGRVTAARWGSPSAPSTLDITIAREEEDQAISWPRSYDTLREGDQSWTQVSTEIDDALIGRNYPTILGAPGDQGSVGANPSQGSPGLVVRVAGSTTLIVVAGHHVAATFVRIFVGGSALGNFLVTNTYDNRGVACATVSVSTVLAEDAEVYVGWSKSDTFGRGLEFQGEPVVGLGDVLSWGATQLSRAGWDTDAIQEHRSVLNQFQIDTYWNKPMTWASWVQANVALYPVMEVQGPKGRYYRLHEWRPRAVVCQGRWTTDPRGGGRRVGRTAAVAASSDAIINRLEVEYGEKPSSGRARLRLVVGPKPDEVLEGPPGGQFLEVSVGSVAAARSDSFFDPYTKVLALPSTWHQATAGQVADAVLARQAVPGRLTRYFGGLELLEFDEGAVVQISDTSFGAYIQDEYAVIEDMSLSLAGVEATVWIPGVPGDGYG